MHRFVVTASFQPLVLLKRSAWIFRVSLTRNPLANSLTAHKKTSKTVSAKPYYHQLPSSPSGDTSHRISGIKVGLSKFSSAVASNNSHRYLPAPQIPIPAGFFEIRQLLKPSPLAQLDGFQDHFIATTFASGQYLIMALVHRQTRERPEQES